MNLKIILGIIIPLVLILALGIVGSLSIGFSVNKSYEKILDLEEVASEGQIRNVVEIGQYRLVNDYFLPKRYSTETIIPCLVDNENIKQPIEAGNIEYSEGDIEPFDKVDIYNYRSNAKSRSIEVSANGEKTIKLLLYPSYMFQYKNLSQLRDEFSEYDSLVLVEKKSSPYYQNEYCYGFAQADFEKGVKIKLQFS